MHLRFTLFVLASASLVFAVRADRDFSGKWVLASQSGRVSVPPAERLAIKQDEAEIRCSSDGWQWTYALNGAETKAQIGGETRNSAVKWEGAALLINTIVTGSREYVAMDRWELSADRNGLTITRQVGGQEATMLYRREGTEARLQPRLDASPGAVIRAGTHIPLTFRNSVDTRHSQEGDRIYLQTAFPVAVDGRIVIPRGSFVTGVVTAIKRPSHMATKGELFIRFDSLTLPNGVMRDFRSRLGNDDEGRISGQPDASANAGQVTRAAGTGATIGVITGSAGGHAGMGAGIGGAAAGIASVLLSRGADARLPQGTTVDMVLDRDLRFTADDLRPSRLVH